ncbi:unnamed protein product [Meganyctiphanes norvegica]|uniref:Carboxylesterase type B domain-containing protein n=1 Tax=Meganyctiphanes norvegica TaxID=48144 RepID=A0AAV2SDJ8_MEGNR
MRMKWALVLAVFVGLSASEEAQPRVETPWGTFLGSVHSSARESRKVYQFTGIPYAKPPLGHLRFNYPMPYGTHTEVFNATKEAPECLQWDNLLGRGIVGQEDCLYLNVYTNVLPQPPHYYNTQPVLVLLHGGTWMSGGAGGSHLQPDYLLESDVTVVTINHRLGPFGFLSTEDKEAPGNYGLIDQVRALEWVRDNVRYFGGMNDSVTVMGSGAGGISAHMLLLSPKARGSTTEIDEFVLLHRAISQSGTAYSPQAILRSPAPKKNALMLAHHAGCPASESTHEMINCLRTISGEKLLEQIPKLYEWDEEPTIFAPVIDKWLGDDAFLPDEPHHLIKHMQFLMVPWIAGNNKDDGAFRAQDILKDTSLLTQLNKNWEKYGPILLELKNSCKDPVDTAFKIRKHYLGAKRIGEETAREFVTMLTDRFFLWPTDQALTDHCYYLRGMDTWCYRYELNFSGRKSFLDILHEHSPQDAAKAAFGSGMSNPRFQNTRDAHGWGVSFLDELLYLFPSKKLDFVYTSDFDGDSASKISTHMLMLWSNFMKGGDPTPSMPGWPEDMSPWGTWWEPFTPKQGYYMHVDPEMESPEGKLKPETMDFWKSLSLWDNIDPNVIRDEL